MSLLSVNQLSCQQGAKLLFEDATFAIDENDKIAVIGPNGCGKSTLLSLLSQATQQPKKEIAIRKGLQVTTLQQNPDVDPEHSIQDHIYKSQSKASVAIQNYHQQLHLYNTDPNNKNEAAYAEAAEKMDALKLWDYEDRVSSILKELKIDNLDQKIKDLSGGMIKKIALAQTFFDESDLLILDEPTNHLDITTIEWLEGMLKKQSAALLMVTHDRYFLDHVCTKIIEIDQQNIFIYQGNYQTYLEGRAARYHAIEKQESSIQSVLRVELAWLRRGPKARSTKQKARKDRIGDLMDRKKISPEDALVLTSNERRLGKKILTLKNVSKSFTQKPLIKDFSHIFSKGEKIGLLGPNGVGKSTFLNLIMERIKPDSGEIEVGINTVFGYFDQQSADFDPDKTIYEHVNEIGSHFTRADGTVVSAAKLLEQFLFPSMMLKSPIGRLSGGEKRRLHLVCLLLTNPNFLLFDEPTNDLDIQTLSVLEDFLLNFSGCIILISHDRYFMDRVVNQVMVFNTQAQIKLFEGNYSDYMDTLKDIEALKKRLPSNPKSTPSREKGTKRSYQETQEMTQLEKDIERLEAEKEIQTKVCLSASATPVDFENAGKKIKLITEQLNKSMARWETLAALE